MAAIVYTTSLTAQLPPRPIASIDLPATPSSIAVSPVTNIIYVAADDRNLYAIDGVTLKVRGPLLPLEGGNVRLTLDPAGPAGDLLHIYDPAVSSGTVWLFDPTMTAPVLRFFDPDGRTSISTLVPSAREPFFETAALGFGSIRTFPNPKIVVRRFGEFRRNLALNTKTQMLYALHAGLVAYNPAFNLTTDIALSGGTPNVVDVNPVTGRVYAGATTPLVPSLDLVSVIEGNGVLAMLPISTFNGDIAVSSTSNRIFTSNNRGEIYSIDGNTHQRSRLASIGRAASLTLNQNTGRLYTNTTAGLAEIDTTGTLPVFISALSPFMTNAVANQVTNRVYLTGGKKLYVFDGTTAIVAARVRNPSASGIRAMSIDVAHNETFIANTGTNNNVTKIIGASGNSTPSFRTIATTNTPVAIATNPVSGKTYVVNNSLLLQPSSVDIIQRPSIFVSKTVKVGFDPVAVAVNPVTGRAYVVTRGGTVGLRTYPPSVSVIDANDTVVATIRVAPNPTGIAVDYGTNKIYVATSSVLLGGDVTIIDENRNLVGLRNLERPDAAGVAVNSRTGFVYVANPASSSVTIIDDAGVHSHLAVGLPATRVAVNEATNRIYVLHERIVSVIEGAAVIATIPLGGVGTAMSIDEGSNRVLVTIDDESTRALAVIDGASNSVSRYPFNGSPNLVVANPRTSTVYVGNTATDEIAIIDLNHSFRPEPRVRLTQTFSEDTTSSPTPTFSVAVDNFNRNIPLRQVYFQIDTFARSWSRATILNGSATFTVGPLADGLHTIYFMASDEESRSPRRDGGGANETIRLGAIASYSFNVKR